MACGNCFGDSVEEVPDRIHLRAPYLLLIRTLLRLGIGQEGLRLDHGRRPRDGEDDRSQKVVRRNCLILPNNVLNLRSLLQIHLRGLLSDIRSNLDLPAFNSRTY